MIQIQSRIKLLSPNLTVMGTAALKAARKLVRDFSEVEHLQVSKKGPGDFVSTADRKAEKIICEELSRARPEYGFLLEEAGEIKTSSDFRFIVDPLDGTTNFLHSLPHFSISIALEYKGEIVSALIYDPLKDEMFYGERGMGAYMNDRRLRVSGRERLPDALMGMSLAHGALNAHHGDLKRTRTYMALSEQSSGMRRSGSAALDLAYIALGRLDAYYAVDLAPWDTAAGMLLVKEAGGLVTSFKQGQKQTLLATNGALHAIIEPHM
jgi:myo-inositol-1(or 4)-monophosphatase